VSPGATYFGLIRLVHRIGLVRKIHNALAQAPEPAGAPEESTERRSSRHRSELRVRMADRLASTSPGIHALKHNIASALDFPLCSDSPR
jgi:hypothetical protein